MDRKLYIVAIIGFECLHVSELVCHPGKAGPSQSDGGSMNGVGCSFRPRELLNIDSLRFHEMLKCLLTIKCLMTDLHLHLLFKDQLMYPYLPSKFEVGISAHR